MILSLLVLTEETKELHPKCGKWPAKYESLQPHVSYHKTEGTSVFVFLLWLIFKTFMELMDCAL